MKLVNYILLIVLTGLYSCDNWLDITPQGQIAADDLYKKESGFKQALTGVYTTLLDPAAYGMELTVGFPDVMAQYWKMDMVNHLYYDFSKFDFQSTNAEEKLAQTWKVMYKAIADINILLEQLESRDTSEFEDYNLIRGEALGLRAYLHMNLLQLYGPVLKNGMDQLSIPYRKVFNNKLVKRMKVAEVLDAAEKDLLAAYQYLQEDPIKIYGRYTRLVTEGQAMAYGFRSIRMNYYAVAATLARLYQLRGEAFQTQAYRYAMEVIEAKDIFSLLKREDVVVDPADRDYMFQREIIWGLYDKNIRNRLGSVLNYVRNDDYSLKVTFLVEPTLRKQVYESDGFGKPDDYRRQYWWQTMLRDEVLWKYYRDENNMAPYQPLLPMVRLSEMYYIASEALIGTDNRQALELLNCVRRARNLDDLPNELLTQEQEILNQIVYEERKEFWGEGKLWYTYKRLFRNILQYEATISANEKLFVLPIPKDEYEYGNN